jgi:2-hydroxymuconate-semialdehyde hydrolase
MANLEQGIVEHGPWKTYVNSAGPRDDRMVLLLHGSGPGATAWSNWSAAVPFLADGFHAVAPDLAGFGKSRAPEPYPRSVRGWLGVWTDQILDLIAHLGGQKVSLIGNSLGGAISLHLLVRRPQLFDRVVLMGTGGAGTQLTPELDIIWGFFDDPSEERMAQIISWFSYNRNLLGDQLQDIARMRFEAAMDPEVRKAFAAMFPGPDRQRHLDELTVPDAALRRIEQPTLLVHGRDDTIVPPRTSHTLLEKRGGPVSMYIYGRCSHWTQIEFRDSFHTLVRSFLEGRL